MPQKYTKARKDGNKRWDDANLDRLSVALPRGYKDRIKEAAGHKQESVNSLIRRAIDAELDRLERGG